MLSVSSPACQRKLVRDTPDRRRRAASGRERETKCYHHQHGARNDQRPRGLVHVQEALVRHHAPVGGQRLHAQPQKREAGGNAIAPGISMATRMNRGGRTFGRTCTPRIREVRAPKARSASTYTSLRATNANAPVTRK